MKKTTLKVLQEARRRIARGWCQHAYAEDSSGCEVGPHHEEAVSWCLTGALEMGFTYCGYCGYPQAPRDGYEDEYQVLCAELGMEVGGDSPAVRLADWNDEATRTREEVLTLLNEAIHSVAEEVAT